MSLLRKSPHSYFGLDSKSPTETALLPPEHPDPVNIEDNCEQLILSLSLAHKLTAL